MRSLARAAALLAIFGLPCAPAVAGGSVSFILGSRSLDKEVWGAVADQTGFGLIADFGRKEWPVHVEIGLHTSGKSESNPMLGDASFTGEFHEIGFGVLKEWKSPGDVHVYAGGGFACVRARAKVAWGNVGGEDDDLSAAFYWHGGIFWRIGNRFNLGLDLRGLNGSNVSFDFGSPLIAPMEGDADYLQLGLLLGWAWPATK